MFDINALTDTITAYKQDFQHIHKEEIYKWRAVKCFKDNWDVGADDFVSMMNCAFAQTHNLLASVNFFPGRMIRLIAEKDPEAVRAMYIELFDESIPVIERIESFISHAEELRLKYGGGAWKSHYQTANSVSVYLFLHNPNKYYIFKYRKFKRFAEKIGCSDIPKMGKIAGVQSYFNMCDEVLEIIKQDTELLDMSKNRLTEKDYPDAEYHILTEDVVFFGSKPTETVFKSWWPDEDEYHPDISKEIWLQLLADNTIFNADSKAIMKRIFAEKDGATCTQLSNKYGQSKNYYNSGSSGLAKRVWKATGCNTLTSDNENFRWWPILYVGRRADKDTAGAYIWKLRPELEAALNEIDLSDISLHSELPAASKENEDEKEKYTSNNFLDEVYISEDDYESLTSLLKQKQNVILQGAPGVGKTYAAKRLAYSMLGRKDENRIKVVQFHQSYSYEDFIMGYKPDETGFKLQTGIFYQFCQQAENNPDEKFFLIIDEINRGNLSKIFGELLMMIEKDYRGEKMTMAYSGLTFSVPKNLYVIGMMNTADRSLAMIDYALRRRFSFYDIRPAFYNDTFIEYQRTLDSEALDELIEIVKRLNQDIANDVSLGDGFCIGHSYFCGQKECTDEWLFEIVEYDLIPMINEYWFDDKAKALTWASRLRGVLND